MLEVVVIDESLEQAGEGILLMRELGCDFAFQQSDIVIEMESHAGKGDGGSSLGCELEFIPSESQLFEQPRQGASFRSSLGEVGHRMEADIVIASVHAIEGVEAADGPMLFEDADLLIVHSQPDTGGQSAHARADDDRVVLRFRRLRIRFGH